MARQDNIQDILDSVKIPCQPPNKSQWKKLEIAVKFINASKKCAEQKRYFFICLLGPLYWLLSGCIKIQISAVNIEILSVVCRKASLKIEPKNMNMTEEEEKSYEEKCCDKVKKKSGRWDKVSKSLHTIA